MTAPATDQTLHGAIVAALGELSDVAKGETADTGAYSYKYASLAAVTGMARPVLAKHGLAISQSVTSQENWLRVSTELVHRSGSVHSSGMLVVELPRNPQQLGSTVTYLRRYQLLALLGLAAEDDDGAKGAQDTSSTAATPLRPATTFETWIEPAPKPHPNRNAVNQIQRIRRLLKKHGGDDPENHRMIIETIIEHPNEHFDDLTQSERNKVESVMRAIDDDTMRLEWVDDMPRIWEVSPA